VAEHYHGSDGSHSRTVETQGGRLGARADRVSASRSS
jgi:hypothetical protein